MPVDEIKRPIPQRHPRSGDALVTMVKDKRAYEELAAARATAEVMPKGRNFH